MTNQLVNWFANIVRKEAICLVQNNMVFKSGNDKSLINITS